MKKILTKKNIGILLSCLLFAGLASTALAVSNPAPPGGVPIESSIAVANVTSGDGKYHDSVAAKVDEVVKFEIWYHNPEPTGSNQIAKNVNVKLSVPHNFAKTHTGTSTVSGSNTNTETDIATVNGNIDTFLEYIPGTAYRRHNIGTAQNLNIVTEKIPDTVTTSGYTIPELKPCWEFQETITAQYRLKAPVFTVTKKVKVEGTDEWKTDITAAPGTKIAYLISFKNISNMTLNDVNVHDSFPPNLEYVKGSAVLTTGKYPNGIPASDNLINGKTIIGDYAPGAAAYIRFNAIVPKSLPQEGCYTFKNVVNVDTNETDIVHNEAYVKSCYEKKAVPPVTPEKPVTPTAQEISVAPQALPVSGPLDALATGFGVMSLGGGTAIWLKSKKKLLSSYLK